MPLMLDIIIAIIVFLRAAIIFRLFR